MKLYIASTSNTREDPLALALGNDLEGSGVKVGYVKPLGKIPVMRRDGWSTGRDVPGGRAGPGRAARGGLPRRDHPGPGDGRMAGRGVAPARRSPPPCSTPRRVPRCCSSGGPRTSGTASSSALSAGVHRELRLPRRAHGPVRGGEIDGPGPVGGPNPWVRGSSGWSSIASSRCGKNSSGNGDPILRFPGVRVLGVIPSDPVLGERERPGAGGLPFRVGRVQRGGHREGDDRAFLRGAMDVEHALRVFRRISRKAVVTGGYRTDIQLAALETDTVCLVLTGGVTPNELIQARAREKGVAILSVARIRWRRWTGSRTFSAASGSGNRKDPPRHRTGAFVRGHRRPAVAVPASLLTSRRSLYTVCRVWGTLPHSCPKIPYYPVDGGRNGHLQELVSS